MKNIFTLLGFLFVLSNVSYAQLSTRENDQTNLKLGARPLAGDMALTFGMNLTEGDVSPLYGGNMLQEGDLITVKYYLTDKLALRAGIRLYQENNKLEGTFSDTSAVYTPPDNSISLKDKAVSKQYIFVPGLEKHFLNSNIFDFYVAGDLYLGFGSEKMILDEEYYSTTTEGTQFEAYDNRESTTNTTNVGFGGVIGFNVFLAQMPISIGLETGWNALWTFGGKTKINRETRYYDWENDVITTYSAEYFWHGDYPIHQFDELKVSEFGMETNQNVRLILNIYFGS